MLQINCAISTSSLMLLKHFATKFLRQLQIQIESNQMILMQCWFQYVIMQLTLFVSVACVRLQLCI